MLKNNFDQMSVVSLLNSESKKTYIGMCECFTSIFAKKLTVRQGASHNELSRCIFEYHRYLHIWFELDALPNTHSLQVWELLIFWDAIIFRGVKPRQRDGEIKKHPVRKMISTLTWTDRKSAIQHAFRDFLGIYAYYKVTWPNQGSLFWPSIECMLLILHFFI